MNAPVIIFFVLAAIAVLGAVSLILQRHPIHSALSLIVVMVALAGLYLLMGAEFVAAVQIIVYGGAIMVLFIFVIMLVRLDVPLHQMRFRFQRLVALLVAFALGVEVLVILLLARKLPGAGLFVQSTAPVSKLPPNSEELSRTLFSNYLLPFEIASVLLLVAMVGAVVMAKGRKRADES